MRNHIALLCGKKFNKKKKNEILTNQLDSVQSERNVFHFKFNFFLVFPFLPNYR